MIGQFDAALFLLGVGDLSREIEVNVSDMAEAF